MVAEAPHADGPLATLASRISSLDVLRRFALLGILLMNVQSFSMPIAAYFNPTAYGDFSGLNAIVWFLVHVFIDQKFMTLFSLLFGAGIILFTSRAEERTGHSAALHYRRMFWLLVFGAAHAYLLWYGDILYTYAVAAFLLYPFRRAAPRKLLIGGLIVFAMATAIGLGMAATITSWPAEMEEQARADWSPTEEQVAAEINAYRSGWSGQLAHRLPMALYVETEILLMYWGWKAAGLMLIGMALFKWGVLSAKSSVRTYRRMAAGGFGVAVPLILIGVALNVTAGWSFEMSLWSSHFNYWGSLAMALGYVGIVMWWIRAGAWPALQGRLAAGRAPSADERQAPAGVDRGRVDDRVAPPISIRTTRLALFPPGLSGWLEVELRS